MAVLIYISAILIPVTSIISQFVGNHKSLTLGRIIISLMSIPTAALFCLINYIGVTENECPEIWILILTLPIALVVFFLQQEFSCAKELRIVGCVAGFFLILFLIGVNLVALQSTTDSYQNRMFNQEETQEAKNSYFRQDDVVKYFGQTMPPFDVIDYTLRIYGPDYNLDVVLLAKDTIPENFFTQSVELLKDSSDSISATDDEFYRWVNGRYELKCKQSNDSIMIHIATW